MSKRPAQRSQLIELFLHVAEQLGCTSERQIADLADVSVDNVANWKSGAVRELKVQTLKAMKDNIASRLVALREQQRQSDASFELGLVPVEVEEASDPAALQRQLADRMVYDYLGHRFLYFDPQGALAWENLIRDGYEQDRWLAGVRATIDAWLAPDGPLAVPLGLGPRNVPKGVDLISLGPGEGGKEAIVLERLLEIGDGRRGPAWVALALVDVSIPLLLRAAKGAKQIARGDRATVHPICADFEEGGLAFAGRLPSWRHSDLPSARLVLLLGNNFGNLRDEESFLRHKLHRLMRPGDLVWIDVGLRPDPIEEEPLFAMTRSDYAPTAAFSNRRLLLEGPYRRWEAAIGRPPSETEMRVWLRERDEASRVPGSVNFCHDLVLKNERRVCTMLYSRRYQVKGLTAWLDKQGMRVLDTREVEDSHGKPRTVHILAERR